MNGVETRTATAQQIRQELMESELSQGNVTAFCKSCKGMREDDLLERVARYLLEQFGLFYQERISVIIKHGGLLACYRSKVVIVLQTSQWISTGQIEALRKHVLENAMALSSAQPDELVSQRVEFCISHLPMPVQQAEEMNLRHAIPIRPALIKAFNQRQSDLAELLFNILDIQKAANFDPDTLIALERFLFSDGAMVKKGDIVNWLTLLEMWVKDTHADIKRLAPVLTLKKTVVVPKGPPAADVVEVEIERLMKEFDDQFYEDRSFHRYVIQQTLRGVCEVLRADMQGPFLELLITYMHKDEPGRKHISYFIHVQDFPTMPLADTHTPRGVFLRAAQRFINFRNRVDLQNLGPLLEWIYYSGSHCRDQFDNTVPTANAQEVFQLTCKLADQKCIEKENCLQIFMNILRLSNIPGFIEFIEAILQQKLFDLGEPFLLGCFESHFNPVNYALSLSACKVIAQMLQAKHVDSMPHTFWADVCVHLSQVADLEARVHQFLQDFAQGEITHKENFHMFIVRYFKGELPPYMFQLLQQFKLALNRPFTLQDTADTFAYPMNPVPQHPEHFEFCCSQIEALERYNLTNGEMGRLFFDFLSVTVTDSINSNIRWLAIIEEFCQLQLSKQVVIAWLHFRPYYVTVEEYEITIGRLLGDLFEYRKKIIEKYLDNIVVPYRFSHPMHEVVAYLSTARPTETFPSARDHFQPACAAVMTWLTFSISSMSAQFFSEAISRKALDNGQFFLEDWGVPQKMNAICSLSKDFPRAIYRAFSTPDGGGDQLCFEMYMLDLTTMRTYGTRKPLEIPWNVLNEQPQVFEIVHQAAVIMGEEKAASIVVNEKLPGFAALLAKYPEMGKLWDQFKKTSVSSESEPEAIFDFIQLLRSHDVGAHPDYIEFQIYLLFYPKFAVLWDDFEPVPLAPIPEPFIPPRAFDYIQKDVSPKKEVVAVNFPHNFNKEDIGIAIANFVFPLKVEFRKSLLYLAGVLPTNMQELANTPPHILAYRGHVYPVERGLSLLPPLPPYRTKTMLEKYAIGEECGKQVEELSKLIQLQQAEHGEIPFQKWHIKGPLEFHFDPKHSRSLRLSLQGASHVVLYEHLFRADNITDLIRWHLAILLSKVYARG